MAKVTVTINELVCKGCGLCVLACPKNVLELSKTKLNAKGFDIGFQIFPIILRCFVRLFFHGHFYRFDILLFHFCK